jgi:hypothetical protein
MLINIGLRVWRPCQTTQAYDNVASWAPMCSRLKTGTTSQYRRMYTTSWYSNGEDLICLYGEDTLIYDHDIPLLLAQKNSIPFVSNNLHVSHTLVTFMLRSTSHIPTERSPPLPLFIACKRECLLYINISDGQNLPSWASGCNFWDEGCRPIINLIALFWTDWS